MDTTQADKQYMIDRLLEQRNMIDELLAMLGHESPSPEPPPEPNPEPQAGYYVSVADRGLFVRTAAHQNASVEAAQAAIKEHVAWLEKMGYTVPEYEVKIWIQK